jgi:hypothetical protein
VVLFASAWGSVKSNAKIREYTLSTTDSHVSRRLNQMEPNKGSLSRFFAHLGNSSVVILRHSESVPIQSVSSDREKHLSHTRKAMHTL